MTVLIGSSTSVSPALTFLLSARPVAFAPTYCCTKIVVQVTSYFIGGAMTGRLVRTFLASAILLLILVSFDCRFLRAEPNAEIDALKARANELVAAGKPAEAAAAVRGALASSERDHGPIVCRPA